VGPQTGAPAEYRGEFGVINSRVPGIVLSDMLPQTARMMNKWSIVRSLHHQDAGHSSGDQICFTGYNARPQSRREYLSVVRRHRFPATRPSEPATAKLCDDSAAQVPGTNSAYLGVAHKPF